jgi:HAD superfamily hydrolase (TIGR01509 family)
VSKLVIFDCDGTLVDSEIIAARVFPAVWSAMGLQMTTDHFLCNFVGTGEGAEVVKRTLALLPSNAMEVADRKFEEELEISLQPVQGIRELLEQIKHQVCVASNSSLAYIRKVLSKTSLSDFFGDRVFSSRVLRKPKPAPDVFLHAATSLGFKPEACIVVEDSISGIEAAKNAGMPVIAFMAGKHFNSTLKAKLLQAKADYYCTSTEELKNLLLNR